MKGNAKGQAVARQAVGAQGPEPGQEPGSWICRRYCSYLAMIFLGSAINASSCRRGGQERVVH